MSDVGFSGARMKVVILAGGYGTRFGKATDFLPKPMIPIGPFPILWHIMRGYAHYGHNEFILCTGYKSEMIKEFFANAEIYANDFTVDFAGDGPPRRTIHRVTGFRPKVTICYTGQDTMTGGRLKRIEHHLANDRQFLVTYGDGVVDLDVNELIRFHNSHGRIATLTGVFPPPKFGDLKMDGHSVTDFAEKEGKQGALVNGGFYVFEREIFRYLDNDTTCVLEKAPMQRLAGEGELQAFKHTGFWQCMDTTRDLEGLQKMWATGQAPWKVWNDDYRD
jgi:glucose-1-phosphate cytidylyltransferase